jgi:malate dehydrogenase
VAVCSDGSYDTDAGLISSFPIRSNGQGGWEIVQGVPVNEFSRGKIAATVQELREEREAVSDLLP